jgi:spermidine synthase
MAAALLYFLFFCSGVSGLVYQVVWVREFGNVFGNTVTSASLVVAIFMLGLGAGGYVTGRWADGRYASAPESLLRVYAYVELVIAALGLAVSLVLPHLGALSAMASSYVQDPSGWYVVSPQSYAARAGVAAVLLAPITLLMGGTLTLLIRHLVRQDVEEAGGWKIATLYAVNTAGAAAGAFLTDLVLVPVAGLAVTQYVAVALNLLAGAGALYLAMVRLKPDTTTAGVRSVRLEPDPSRRVRLQPAVNPNRSIRWTAIALALTGFAAMGMEILWLRHFNLLLGGFRAVFALLMTVVLLGIAAGSLLGGWLDRRSGRPAEALMVVQALFAASALAGLAAANVPDLLANARSIEATLRSLASWERAVTEIWYNARPILVEAGVPALLMGCSFPLGNAMIQHAEAAVGRRAGMLYLANTAGAVAGSIVAGYVLLPGLGLQGAATGVLAAAGLAILPLYLASRSGVARPPLLPAASGLIVVAALAVWVALPSDYLVRRSLPPLGAGERLVTVNEGVNEIIAVTEAAGKGRALITNGHPMSSTALLDQRYMRALAHIPLLSMSRPEDVLVIGFGVGNTADAARLHPSVRRVDVADLSRQVLRHAGYFRDANGSVLEDDRVAVYLNDGRQHLQMQPPASYDLITLEPPPISHAGVGALYSREFYEMARARLKPGGYLSQWLPAYQVPAETSLAMVRAFVDVFPASVLLSGSQAELLLVGTTAPTIEIDPSGVAAALNNAPAVQSDLRRLDLGTVTQIAGTFVSASGTLRRASQEFLPATDDRALQEYGVRSVLGSSLLGVPGSLFALRDVSLWCPRCFDGQRPAPDVEGLDTYLALLEIAYAAPVAEVAATVAASHGTRRLLGSRYLGAVVPESATVYQLLAADLVENGRSEEAMTQLRRAVELDPANGRAQYDLGSLLLEQGRFVEAADRFRAALRAMPESAEVHNNLGVALASMADVDGAVDHFRRAVALQPDFAEARRNLTAAMTLPRVLP